MVDYSRTKASRKCVNLQGMILVYRSVNNWAPDDKLEFVGMLRLKGASEILAVARVKSCRSARLNQPCRLVKLPAQRAAKSSAGIRPQGGAACKELCSALLERGR